LINGDDIDARILKLAMKAKLRARWSSLAIRSALAFLTVHVPLP
jgi:hypothetical protein